MKQFPLLLLTALVGAAAQDRTELERTPIVGNRELPKVLYIVPWKKPPPPAPPPPAPPAPAADALAPIDRDVLRRQLRQRSLLSPNVPGATP